MEVAIKSTLHYVSSIKIYNEALMHLENNKLLFDVVTDIPQSVRTLTASGSENTSNCCLYQPPTLNPKSFLH